MRTLADEPPEETGRHMYATEGDLRIDTIDTLSNLLYLPCSSSTDCATRGEITAQHIGITLIDRRSDVIEFADKRVFEPIYQHF